MESKIDQIFDNHRNMTNLEINAPTLYVEISKEPTDMKDFIITDSSASSFSSSEFSVI